MSRFVQPVTLAGAHWVSLEPLGANHIPEMAWVSRMAVMQDADEGVTYVIRRRTDDSEPTTLAGSHTARCHTARWPRLALDTGEC